MKLMESATWSYNLSSIAVDPMSSRSISIFSSTAATFSSRLAISSLAAFDSSFHALYVLSSIYRSAK